MHVEFNRFLFYVRQEVQLNPTMTSTEEAVGAFTGRPISELRGLLDNMAGERVDGVLYQYFGFNQPILQHFDTAVRDLEVRDDDVITLGFPRSGNHFAYEVGQRIDVYNN